MSVPLRSASTVDAPAPAPPRASAPRALGLAAAGPLGPFPLHAVAVVVAAWLLFGVLVLMYSMMALMLLPVLPVFLFGPVCLLSWAHGYAREAREHGSGRT
ncbi:MAG TPA: hypothetical protein VNN80_04480 [Polyangiaceae bacterium]|nr:hypothetical protein [Polyangiaceae bacterium]